MFTPTQGLTIENPNTFDELGLTLRDYRDKADYEAIAKVLQKSRVADGLEEARTGSEIATLFHMSRDFEPEHDIFIVEKGNQAVAYAVTRWWEEKNANFIHAIILQVVPEWRNRGIEWNLLARCKARSIESVQKHQQHGTNWFHTYTAAEQQWLIELLEAAGFAPARYFYDMVRPNLENIPNVELPAGLEVRPVQPEHYKQIWQAAVEAFAEHWGEQEHNDNDLQNFLNMPHFNPSLWQVAWHGDQVVGMVLNYFNPIENADYKRKRGYTEDISVRKPWRGRGVARALIVRSLKMFRDMGFDSTALGVDAENATGALHLYESLGYQTVHKTIAYRKRIE